MPEILFRRAWAMPNCHTFLIPPINTLMGIRKIAGYQMRLEEMERPTQQQMLGMKPGALAKRFPVWEAAYRIIFLCDDLQKQMVAALAEGGTRTVGQ